VKTRFVPSQIESGSPASRMLNGVYRFAEKMVHRLAYHTLIIGQKQKTLNGVQKIP